MQLEQALQTLPQPPRELFADAVGESKYPDDAETVAAASNFTTSIAQQLHHLAQLTATIDAVLLGLEELVTESNIHSRSIANAPLSGILIEEVTDEEAAVDHLPPAVALLLVAALYGLDDALLVERPWSAPATRDGARLLYSTLTSKVPLEAVLPAALTVLRSTMVAPAEHAATETSRLEPYTGPDEWERFLAAGQVTSMVWQLQEESLWKESDVLWERHLLPMLAAAVQDPSPIVQNYALWALQHVVHVSSARNLVPWAPKLVDIARKTVIGCDSRAWPAAAAAATAIALKADASSSPYSPLIISLFDALLEEAERHSHDPSRVTIWLETVPQSIFPLLGLQLATYFRRLMPLLLEWCTSIQKKVRLGALRAVHAVVRATWPRIPAHAHLIWSVVEAAYQDEGALSAHPSDNILNAAVEVAAVLWQCGGESFQERVREQNIVAKDEMNNLPSLLDRVLQAQERGSSVPHPSIPIIEQL